MSTARFRRRGASTRLNSVEACGVATTCRVQNARIMIIWRSSNNYRKEVIQCLIVGRHWLISAVSLPKGNIAVTRKPLRAAKRPLDIWRTIEAGEPAFGR